MENELKLAGITAKKGYEELVYEAVVAIVGEAAIAPHTAGCTASPDQRLWVKVRTGPTPDARMLATRTRDRLSSRRGLPPLPDADRPPVLHPLRRIAPAAPSRSLSLLYPDSTSSSAATARTMALSLARLTDAVQELGGKLGHGKGIGAGGAQKKAGAEEELSELSLLWAVSSLPSLDVLLLLMPDDERNLRLCRLLTRSAPFLAAVHQRQTSAPQLVVRLADPSSEAAYEHEAASLAPFRLTLAGAWAAMPNLLAEMLHPTSHWSLHVDNDVAPAAAHGSAAAAEQAKIQRSGASAEGASELQAAPLFARTDSASSL